MTTGSGFQPRGKRQGGRGCDTHSHTHALSYTRLLLLSGPGAQVGAGRQPHAAAGASAPPGKGLRPPGTARRAGDRAHARHLLIRPPRRPRRLGSRGLGDGRGCSTRRPRARARPSPAFRPSPRAARRARRRQAPASLGISLLAGPGDPGNFPGTAGGGDPGASAAWTHFFGCFSLFGLRFRA